MKRSHRMARARGLTRGLAALVLGGGGLLWIPGEAAAQTLGGDCRLMDTFGTLTQREISPGNLVQWVTRADLRCPNGLRIRADSAVVYGGSGRNELMGNVRFTTPERDLRADLADWYEQEGRLVARGRVVFGDLTQGTEVRGDTLNYLEARGNREEQVIVAGSRPSATLPADPRADGTPGEPFRVTANRLRFQGERFFWGDGNVELRRDDLEAAADSLVYDREADLLILNGDARVQRGEVSATGGNLNLNFENDQLRRLAARNGGRVETGDYTLSGVEVTIELGENEEILTVLAEAGEVPEGGGRLEATLEGNGLFLKGRRVEVEDAEDGMRLLRATGQARAEALGRGFGEAETVGAGESARTPGVGDGFDEDGFPDRDWIQGEEILAWFEPAPEGEGAGEGEGVREAEEGWRLVRLESTGNAAALYRSPPDEEETTDPSAPPATTDPDEGVTEADDAPLDTRARWSITYILADRIVLFLEEGEVRFLEAEGNVRGQQLEPRQGGGGA